MVALPPRVNKLTWSRSCFGQRKGNTAWAAGLSTQRHCMHRPRVCRRMHRPTPNLNLTSWGAGLQELTACKTRRLLTTALIGLQHGLQSAVALQCACRRPSKWLLCGGHACIGRPGQTFSRPRPVDLHISIIESRA